MSTLIFGSAVLCSLGSENGAGPGSRTRRFPGYEPGEPPLLHVRQEEDTVLGGSALARLDHQRLDALERRILEDLPPVHMPVEHTFTPGLYRRTITMPPGTLLTSKIHRTEHPYAVLRGAAFVLVAGEEPVLLEAGNQGVTKPMTRRALFIPHDSEPCVWSTFHTLSPEEEQMRQNGATIEAMLAAIERRIIEAHLHLDGADAHQEYIAALEALGLPGPHDGARALEEDTDAAP